MAFEFMKVYLRNISAKYNTNVTSRDSCFTNRIHLKQKHPTIE